MMNLLRPIPLFPLCLLACLPACSALPQATPPPRAAGIVGQAALARTTDNPIALMIGDHPVGWGELRPLLAEAAGGRVVGEVVLGRLLDAECARAGVEVSPLMIARERELVAQTLSIATASSAGSRLVDSMRVRRGLGEQRYNALLRRSAQLRALIAGDVRLSDAQLNAAARVRFGPRRSVRVITSPNVRLLASLRQRVINQQGPSARTDAFARLAREHSTDPSAVDGGRLAPINTDDPAVAESLRRVIAQTQPGEVTPITTVGGLSAIVLVEGELEGVPVDDAVTPARLDTLRNELTQARQQQAMTRLSERLLATANVAVLDRALGWSYRNRNVK